MLRRLMVVAIFFVPIGAVACWVTWFSKRSRINNVAQSWMREKRREYKKQVAERPEKLLHTGNAVDVDELMQD